MGSVSDLILDLWRNRGEQIARAPRAAAYLVIITAIVLLAQFQAVAQTTGTKTPPQVLGPEEFERQLDAYEQAMRIANPEQRIAALQKLLRDFPDHPPRDLVNRRLLETYLKFWPEKTEAILALIEQNTARLSARQRGSPVSNTRHEIAAKLLAAGVLLDKAAELEATALAELDEKQFADFDRRRTRVMGSPEQSEDEIARKFRAERARLLATQGRILLKQGKPAEAEKTLLEAFAANTAIMEANTALADLALQAGRDAAALEYLIAAALSGSLLPQYRRQLEAVYRRTHGDSLAGLEATLTARYKSLFPNPIKVERYKPTPARTDRTALVEVFTGAACVPCVSAELVFEAAQERYTTRELAVLMYHVHIPSPDPMANPATEARATYYEVGSAPVIVIDGVKEGKGGGPRDLAQRVYARIEPLLERRLETGAEARIKLKAWLKGETIKVKATADRIAGAPRALRLRLALAEDDVYYIGENRVRVHLMVVRKLAGEADAGLAFNGARGARFEHTFDLARISAEIKEYLDDYEARNRDDEVKFSEKKYRLDAGKLAVVAFVQDETNQRILQASALKVKAGRFVR